MVKKSNFGPQEAHKYLTALCGYFRTELYPNWSRNVDIMARNSFATSNKVQLSVRPLSCQLSAGKRLGEKIRTEKMIHVTYKMTRVTYKIN